VAHDTVRTGAPILRDCLIRFDCSLHQRLEVGDHVVLSGRIQALGTNPAVPLGFCRGRYAEVKDPLPPEWSPSRDMIVGYIIEADGRILLRATGGGKWSLPIATGRQKTTARSQRRAKCGIDARRNVSQFDLRCVGRLPATSSIAGGLRRAARPPTILAPGLGERLCPASPGVTRRLPFLFAALAAVA
jgi:hypothetical protein